MLDVAVPGAYYAATVSDFLGASAEFVVGALTLRSGSVDATQRDAWVGQIQILKNALAECHGTVFLEFDVPRIGSRIDDVLICGPALVIIEFKVGEQEFRTTDRNQVWDYALDLKNFHRGSHAAPIAPILVATEAPEGALRVPEPADDGVYPPLACNALTFCAFETSSTRWDLSRHTGLGLYRVRR